MASRLLKGQGVLPGCGSTIASRIVQLLELSVEWVLGVVCWVLSIVDKGKY